MDFGRQFWEAMNASGGLNGGYGVVRREVRVGSLTVT